MPGKGDEAVGTKGIGIVPVAACRAEESATQLAQAALQLPAVQGRVFPHGSGGEHEFVAKGGRNGASRFQQGFKMHLGGLLKSENGLTAILAV